MDSSKVIPIINSLIEEIDYVLDELNQKGARNFFTSDYKQAKEILNNVDQVNIVKGKILSISDDWKKINLDISEKKEIPGKNSSNPGDNKTKQKLAKGLRTKTEDFKTPILLALDSLGGAGDIHDVMNIIEDLMALDLTEFDWEPLPSDPNLLRWKNNVQWARLSLVKEGLLSNKSPKGIWEITESGRTTLMNSKKKLK
jgi:restriction system protein